MRLLNRITRLEGSTSAAPSGLSILQLAEEAINRWRQEQGLSPVVVSRESLEFNLRQMSPDRLVSLYQDCLGIGPRESADCKRFRSLSDDELRRRYAEAMGH